MLHVYAIRAFVIDRMTKRVMLSTVSTEMRKDICSVLDAHDITPTWRCQRFLLAELYNTYYLYCSLVPQPVRAVWALPTDV